MKKILLAFCFVALVFTARAQFVTIPDAKFAAYLQQQYPSCMSGTQLDISCPQITGEKTLNLEFQQIGSLEGLQYFTSLEYLNCSYNLLTTLPDLPLTLTYLDCNTNELTGVPVLPPNLQYFVCSNNKITSLPDLPATLIQFGCNNNLLTGIPVPGPAVTDIECSENQIFFLPPMPATLLTLGCTFNQLVSLPDLSSCTVLRLLNCNDNKLTSLPNLPASLKEMNASTNQLTALPTLPTSLINLNFGSNLVTIMPAINSNLEILNCYGNKLTALPALPASVKEINCNGNLIPALPALPASLEKLSCSTNKLTALPALPVGLKELTITSNLITALPALPSTLRFLYADNNKLTALPALPASLTVLSCSANLLTTLPALPVNLTQLMAQNNKLTALPALPSLLKIFQVNNNLNLLCMPFMQEFGGTTKNSFQIFTTGIKCLPNKPKHSTYIAAIDTMPICGIMNANGCALAWNVNGQIYKDDNADCMKDAGEANLHSIKVNLKQGGSIIESAYFSNSYSFKTAMNTYTVGIDTAGLPFNIICPVNTDSTVVVSMADSLHENVNFALQCKPGSDEGVWSIVNGGRFFPGENPQVRVKAGDIAKHLYGAGCSSGVGGTLQVIINGKADYVAPAIGALTPAVSGNTLTYTIPDFSAIDANTAFAIELYTHTDATIGDTVCIDVTVTPATADNNSTNNTLSHCFAIVNSFDPNVKEVSPVGNLDYPFNDWLTYTIHFQNTGNAPAKNIQVLDTLDDNLQWETFQLLSASVNPVVQLKGKYVTFSFPNINLADSTSNEPESHGYVQYRIKPLADLPAGTTINNSASIYFDFNAPVKTNTVASNIKLNTSIKYQDTRHKMSVYPNPVAAGLTVTGAELGAAYTIADITGRVVLSGTFVSSTSTINVKQLAAGVYLLRAGNGSAVKVVKE